MIRRVTVNKYCKKVNIYEKRVTNVDTPYIKVNTHLNKSTEMVNSLTNSPTNAKNGRGSVTIEKDSGWGSNDVRMQNGSKEDLMCNCICHCVSKKLCGGKGVHDLGLHCHEWCQYQCSRKCDSMFTSRLYELTKKIAKTPHNGRCGKKCVSLCTSIDGEFTEEDGIKMLCRKSKIWFPEDIAPTIVEDEDYTKYQQSTYGWPNGETSLIPPHPSIDLRPFDLNYEEEPRYFNKFEEDLWYSDGSDYDFDNGSDDYFDNRSDGDFDGNMSIESSPSEDNPENGITKCSDYNDDDNPMRDNGWPTNWPFPKPKPQKDPYEDDNNPMGGSNWPFPKPKPQKDPYDDDGNPMWGSNWPFPKPKSQKDLYDDDDSCEEEEYWEDGESCEEEEYCEGGDTHHKGPRYSDEGGYPTDVDPRNSKRNPRDPKLNYRDSKPNHKNSNHRPDPNLKKKKPK